MRGELLKQRNGYLTWKWTQKVNVTRWSFQPLQKEQPQGKKQVYQSNMIYVNALRKFY